MTARKPTIRITPARKGPEADDTEGFTHRFADSVALCRHIATRSEGRCLLAFSTGKDSIGAYIQLRRHFTDIIPFYLYLVPDLEFVEESLTYYESIMGRRILRLPHPSLYRWLNNLVFQAPQ